MQSVLVAICVVMRSEVMPSFNLIFPCLGLGDAVITVQQVGRSACTTTEEHLCERSVLLMVLTLRNAFVSPLRHDAYSQGMLPNKSFG